MTISAGLTLFCALIVGTAVTQAASSRFERTRIPHLDASGRATIVEIDPTVPGARRFLEGDAGPIPKPGQVLLPARPTPERSPGGIGAP